MATYLMLSNLTDEGAETVKRNPERIKEVNKEVEAMGVKIVAQYARVSIEMGARGSVKIQTLPLIPIDTFVASMKR